MINLVKIKRFFYILKGFIQNEKLIITNQISQTMNVLTKSILFFALIAAIILACSPSDDDDPALSAERTFTSSSEDNFLAQFKANESNANGRVKSDILDRVNWNSAYKSINHSIGRTAYTLPLFMDKPSQYDNLVIINENGNQELYIIRYEPDEDWLAAKPANTDLDTFTGIISILDTQGITEASTSYSAGEPIISDGLSNGRVTDCHLEVYIEWTEVCVDGYGCHITEYEVKTVEICSGSSGDGGSSGDIGGGDDPGGMPDGGAGDPGGYPVICGEGMVSDGSGGCVINTWEEGDQTVGKLCPDAVFKLTGSGFTAEILNLGLTAINYRESKVIDVQIPSSCITIPSYNLSTGADAADVFSVAFNNARENVYRELTLDKLEENSVAVRARLIELIRFFLVDGVQGSSFSSGSCSGDIPITEANYGC